MCWQLSSIYFGWEDACAYTRLRLLYKSFPLYISIYMRAKKKYYLKKILGKIYQTTSQSTIYTGN